jgi:hypothetical protein
MTMKPASNAAAAMALIAVTGRIFVMKPPDAMQVV